MPEDFDDTGWSNGLAELGYGDAVPSRDYNPERTVVRFGPQASNKYITTYFRHAFTVTDPTAFTNLIVRLLRDDGAVVYLNGTEIFRDNIRNNPVLYDTLAIFLLPDTGTVYLQTNASPALRSA